MENASKEKLVEEILSSMIQSKYTLNLYVKLSGFKSAYDLSRLCLDYRSSSYIFKRVMEALKKESCDLGFVYEFLDACISVLSRWDYPQQSTDIIKRLFPCWAIPNNGLEGEQDTVRVFLEFSREVMDIMEKKGFTPSHSSGPDNHPMNQSLARGIIGNIPLLLRYGLGLEFTMDFYWFLKDHVVSRGYLRILSSRQLNTYFGNGSYLPKRRVFLVLLATFWYIREANGCRIVFANRQWNNALKLIWRSIPDAQLCRREFFEVFAGDADKMKAISEHYGKMVCEDDFTDLPVPRSMAHLSRMKIREALALNKQLPMGVYDLSIPKALQTYVLLGS